MTTLIFILCISSLGYLLAEAAEPASWLKRLYFKEENYNTYSNRRKAFHRLLHCSLCLTFWLALIITGSLLVSALSSITAEVISRLMKKI